MMPGFPPPSPWAVWLYLIALPAQTWLDGDHGFDLAAHIWLDAVRGLEDHLEDAGL